MVAMASNAEMFLLLTLGKKITNNIADDEWEQEATPQLFMSNAL